MKGERGPMQDERQKQASGADAEQQAERKADEERELEKRWSQGGQDVEEEQHDAPGERP